MSKYQKGALFGSVLKHWTWNLEALGFSLTGPTDVCGNILGQDTSEP